MTDYQPIENYGVIGDLNTVALVGLNGSIDFMCFPYFDSPSIFCGLLDVKKGGKFSINPIGEKAKNRQMYLPDTNVLLTRFLSEEGVGEITDFMPAGNTREGHVLIRRVTQVRGADTYIMQCEPRFDYARTSHSIKAYEKSLIFESEEASHMVLRLTSSVPLKIQGCDGFAKFLLRSGETADFILEYVYPDRPHLLHEEQYVDTALLDTTNFWKTWTNMSQYKGRWQETINRSALMLKLLTSKRYGTMVASPTFGLPEKIGGEKNWDYRYSWIRDSAFTLYALIRLGYTREAGDYIHWLGSSCHDLRKPGELGLMYSVQGKKELDEVILTHLEGYKKSAPVRIGNAAYKQLQLDIYGEMMDSVYLYDKYAEPISYDFWNAIIGQLNWLSENWRQPDEAIWEVRGGRREFLYSRLLCWVAIDRGVRLAVKRSLPFPRQWLSVREEIYYSIFNEFWNESKQAFVQFKGADKVDAGTLIMPLMRFISPRDPRWLSTLKCIENELVSDSLVFRYSPEDTEATGLQKGEGTFSLCSFWYVECLSRSGQIHKARYFFEKMLGYANHLGLYAEQIGFEGEHLGNFPQAFTHLGLISAAYNLNTQLNDERNRAAY